TDFAWDGSPLPAVASSVAPVAWPTAATGVPTVSARRKVSAAAKPLATTHARRTKTGTAIPRQAGGLATGRPTPGHPPRGAAGACAAGGNAAVASTLLPRAWAAVSRESSRRRPACDQKTRPIPHVSQGRI